MQSLESHQSAGPEWDEQPARLHNQRLRKQWICPHHEFRPVDVTASPSDLDFRDYTVETECSQVFKICMNKHQLCNSVCAIIISEEVIRVQTAGAWENVRNFNYQTRDVSFDFLLVTVKDFAHIQSYRLFILWHFKLMKAVTMWVINEVINCLDSKKHDTNLLEIRTTFT